MQFEGNLEKWQLQKKVYELYEDFSPLETVSVSV